MTTGRPFAGIPHIANDRRSLGRSVAVLALLSLGHTANAQTVLPNDVDKSCIVKEDDFKGWFENGNIKEGKAKPANSLEFTPNSACSFYRWSEQMFLWLTSPTGPGRYVFNSRNFFAVDGSGDNRTLVPQDDPVQKGFAPSIALKDDKKQDVVTDSTGKTHSVVRVQAMPNTSSLFVDKSNKTLAVARVASAVDGKPILLDKFDKALNPKKSANGAPAVNAVSLSGKPIRLADTTVLVDNVQRLVTTDGAVIEIGPGQAQGNDVLMTKDEAIVYYLIQVNDVFAYFKTGALNNKFPQPPIQFPVDKTTSDAVADIAKNAPAPHQRDIVDGVALAVELKSSWVDASTLPNNAQGYLTVKATIPVYESTGESRRKQTGAKPVDLAMVGFHVVGSTLGHPEMIWATFEHVNNAPNLQYNYRTSPTTVVLRPADGPGAWLFSQGQPASGAPESRMRVDPDPPPNTPPDIVARPTKTIGPVNVTRINPWGKPPGEAAAGNNTNIISINNSVLGQLDAGDVRKNYIMVGATWTDGNPPTANNQKGSTILANATMETFKQPKNCFGCHSGDTTDMLSLLSHIWDPMMTPLFPKQ